METLMRNQNHHHCSDLARLGLDQEGVRVLVVGLGVTGLSVIKFLEKNHIEVAVIDSRETPPGLDVMEESYRDIAVFTGGFKHAVFEAATHIIVSPGVSLDEDEIQTAAERGVPVFGDIDLFAVCADAPVVGITGSNGKSTVTTLLAKMAEKAKWDVRAGGNLGTPALDLLSEKPADLYVLELSSFQLERTSQLKADVVTLLNISDDHMDRYQTLTAYCEAKERIFYGDGVAVINRQDAVVSSMQLPSGRKIISFGLDRPQSSDYGLVASAGHEVMSKGDSPILPVSELKLKGRHNIQNAMAAMAMADSLNLPKSAQIEALKVFPGLEHRTQWVADIQGVTWINDSKATNPGACLAALTGLGGPIILIAGGDGKGADFNVLAKGIEAHVSLLILIGRDAKRFQAEAAGDKPVVMAENIEEAVQVAASRAVMGETVLLSPACASLDQFANYQQRGNRFIAAVRELAA